MQNYPNPFNNSTVIRFDLPRASEVQLTIYNIIGQMVLQRTRYYEAGYHEFVWDGRSGSGEDVAGGVYFYRLQAGSFTSAMKMLLIK
jgi:flagellar hook assembly protein FlgD